MKIILIFQILLIVVFSLNGQDKNDCNEVLEEEIYFFNDSLLSNQIDQVKKFNNCFLDSIDLEILWSGPFIGVLLVDSETKKKKITFDDLLKNYNSFKTTPGYLKIRRIHGLVNRLAKKKITYENWGEDKLILKELELPQSEINKIEDRISKGELFSYTYEQLFEELKEGGESEESVFKPPINRSVGEPRKSIQSVNIEYAELLAQSKEEKKPLLLFFTGFGCLNAIKMEQSVLSAPVVLKTIQDNFIFQELYIDDRTKLEKEIVTKGGMKLKTVGHKNIDLQVTKFQNNSQPFFVIVDESGQVIAQVGFVLIEKFRNFLKKGIAEK